LIGRQDTKAQMKRTLYIFLFSILLSTLCVAQSPDRVKQLADRYFDDYAYDRAIRLYEDIPEKSTDVQRNLAASYMKLSQPLEAEKYLQSLVSGTESQPRDFFNYSQVLAMNRKYKESVKWMTKFHEQKANDTRAELVVEEPDYFVDLESEDLNFSVVNLDINSPEEDFGPSYFKDKVVFASSRTGVETVVRRWNWNQLAFLDLYVADSLVGSQLKSPRRFSNKKINKKFHEGPATFDEAGEVMIYTSNNYNGRSAKGEVNLKLFECKREGEEWSNPVPLPYNSKEYSVGHASLTPDGNSLYFVSDMPGGKGQADLYRASRQADGTWGQAENLELGINTEGNEMFPFIQSDSILFFASDGLLGSGGLDIFFVDLRHDGVRRPKNIRMPVNSSMDDFALVMNKARTGGFFSSNREGGKGDDDIYSFTLPEPMRFNRVLRGKVTDQNGELITDVTIQLIKDGVIIKDIVTGANGTYEFEVLPDAEYAIKGKKQSFSNGTNFVDQEQEEHGVVTTNLMLTKGTKQIIDVGPALDIFADFMQITDDGMFYHEYKDMVTNEPLEGAKVTILDELLGREEVFITPSTGDNTRALDKRKITQAGDFSVRVEKEGYSTMEYDYNPAFDKEGQYRQIVGLIPDNYAQDALVKDHFEIKPIYFDLDKHDIRTDAALELDKIVELMTKMPEMVIELTAHTDCRANKNYNDRLSNNRAVVTAKYIQERIDNPQRIYGEGRGELMLANDCACEGELVSDCPEEAHQENRRTEFRIIRF